MAGAPPSVGAAIDLLERFSHWATEAGATVERVPDEEAAQAAIRTLADRLQARRITATPEAARYAPPRALVRGSTEEVADAELGVSLARLAVAETGSVLLGSNQGEDRLVGILALTHAIVVPAGRIVPSLDDAAAQLRQLARAGEGQLRYLQLVTGPSRTGDIECVLTIGVQGPQAVHLIVVGEPS